MEEISMAKTKTIEKEEVPEILKRLCIIQNDKIYNLIMDLSDIISFSNFHTLDTVLSKVGLVIKNQFGYLGYQWGYGKVDRVFPLGMQGYSILEAKVSLSILFNKPIDNKFLIDNNKKLQKIYSYIETEYNLFYNKNLDSLNEERGEN